MKRFLHIFLVVTKCKVGKIDPTHTCEELGLTWDIHGSGVVSSCDTWRSHCRARTITLGAHATHCCACAH